MGAMLTWLAAAFAPLLFVPLAYLLFGGASFAGALERSASVCDAINKSVARVAVWCALLMALVQFTVVIFRYVFGLSFLWMQESVIYLHGALFLLTAGYALLTDDHVRVDIFYREASERRKAVVNMIGTYFFLFPMSAIAVWMARPYVAASWAVREGSTEASGIQAVYLLKTLIPIFAVLLIIQGFSLAAHAALTLRRRRANA